MRKGYFVVVVLGLAAVVGLFALTAIDMRAFVDVPSLATVIAPALIMGFAAHSPREIARAYRVAFSGQEASREELGQAEAYFDGLIRYLACGGGLGVAIGLVAVFGFVVGGLGRNVADTGRGLALTLLVAVYALVLIMLVALPFRTAIRKRLAGA